MEYICHLFEHFNTARVTAVTLPSDDRSFVDTQTLCQFEEKIGNGWKKILWQSGKIAFIFSISIEMLQLLLRLGTFQLSDIFYNTLGGMIGGLMYCVVMKARKRL